MMITLKRMIVCLSVTQTHWIVKLIIVCQFSTNELPVENYFSTFPQVFPQVFPQTCGKLLIEDS